MSEIRYREISKPKTGRRFAISDIHGCAKTFEALLNQIQFNIDDHLYIVGDLINRGPRSHQVLKLVIRLQEEGHQIFLVRGNHEQIILKSQEKSLPLRKRIAKSYRAHKLLNKAGDLKEKYFKVLSSTYHYLILDDYYLVHAGFNFSTEKPFEDEQFMLYSKKFKVDKSRLSGRKVLIGHTPKKLSKIVKRVKKGKQKIYLDNGCVNYKTKEQGNLLCLDLDTLAISIHPNIDYQ